MILLMKEKVWKTGLIACTDGGDVEGHNILVFERPVKAPLMGNKSVHVTKLATIPVFSLKCRIKSIKNC
jgi:hypothetical protein